MSRTFIRCFSIILVFSLPFLVGSVFRYRSVSLTYLSGQMLLWAVFQICAVPCIHFRATFTTLFWIYAMAVLILVLWGIWSLRSGMRERITIKDWMKQMSPFLGIACMVILFQMGVYVFGMHLDEDDARWIAEANDALVKNRMLLHNPATGEYIGRFVGEMVKDVYSPWSMYIAWLSRVIGIRAVVIAHTIYPPVLLALSYFSYYQIGVQLFAGKHEKGIFLLMVSVINLFMAGNPYTQSVFTLVRIWQGKAVVAAVIIPGILMIMLRLQQQTKPINSKLGERIEACALGSIRDWILLIITGTASCLLSGMGIAIGLLMIGIYGGYVVLRMIIRSVRTHEYRNCIFRICLWSASMIPSIVYGLAYMRLKG